MNKTNNHKTHIPLQIINKVVNEVMKENKSFFPNVNPMDGVDKTYDSGFFNGVNKGLLTFLFTLVDKLNERDKNGEWG